MKILILVSLFCGIVFSSFKNIPQSNKNYKINDSIDSIEQTYIVELLDDDTLIERFIDTSLVISEPDTIAEPVDISDITPIDDNSIINNQYAEPDTSTLH